MAGKSKKPAANNLRAWREAMGPTMTLSKLAALSGVGVSTISELESGGQQLTEALLIKIAPHLNTKPGLILDYLPDDPRVALLAAVSDVGVGEPAKKAAEVIRLFSSAPTRRSEENADPEVDHLRGSRSGTSETIGASQNVDRLPKARQTRRLAPRREERDDR